MTEALLQISNLSAAYGQVFALRDFSCAIEEGKITALVGRGGAVHASGAVYIKSPGRCIGRVPDLTIQRLPGH